MNEKAKTDAINEGQKLFRDFFENHADKIANIISNQCVSKLTDENIKSVTEFTINRYNDSKKNNFEEFQNGVGPSVVVDTLKDDNQKTFFDADLTVKTIPATAFNDLYKWTMMPVIRKMELKKAGSEGDPNNSCLVTFGVDLRDPTMLKKIQTDTELRENIFKALNGLTQRNFDKTHFNDCLNIAGKEHILDADKANITNRPLVDGKVLYNGIEKPEKPENFSNNLSLDGINQWRKAENWEPDILDVNKVNIHFFTKESNDDTRQIFIEATGPWHKVTWLETSMMQCVYETVLRKQLADANVPYNVWLCDALLRTAMSIALTKDNTKINTMKGALFTGRRTGGFLFLILQNLMYETYFSHFNPETNIEGKSLGSSSCDALLILDNLKYRKDKSPIQPAGTHAHELSMVNSALYPKLDLIVPGATQIIGHYLYYKLSMLPKKLEDDKVIPAGPIPALPDTIGTNVFLNAAKTILIKDKDKEKEFMKSFFDLINDKSNASAFRQDSGELKTFKERVTKCGYDINHNKHGMMASEIEVVDSLFKAQENGYKNFGAGGFYGDSAKVWTHPEAASNSMAVKAIRVLTSDNNYTIIKKDKLDTTKFISDCDDNKDNVLRLIEEYNASADVENIFAFPIKTGDKENGKECEESTKLAIDHNTSVLTKRLKILQAQSIQKKYNDAIQNNFTERHNIVLDINDMEIKTSDDMEIKSKQTRGGKRRRTRKRSKRTKRRSQLKQKRSQRKRTRRSRR